MISVAFIFRGRMVVYFALARVPSDEKFQKPELQLIRTLVSHIMSNF